MQGQYIFVHDVINDRLQSLGYGVPPPADDANDDDDDDDDGQQLYQSKFYPTVRLYSELRQFLISRFSVFPRTDRRIYLIIIQKTACVTLHAQAAVGQAAAGPAAVRPFVRPYSSYYRYQLVNDQHCCLHNGVSELFDTRLPLPPHTVPYSTANIKVGALLLPNTDPRATLSVTLTYTHIACGEYSGVAG